MNTGPESLRTSRLKEGFLRSRISALLLLGLTLGGAADSYGTTLVAIHLGHLNQVDFYIHISDLTDADLPGIPELEERIRQEALKLISLEGIEVGRQIEPALSVRAEIWEAGLAEGKNYAVLLSASLQEMVVVARVPDLGETSALTWSRQEIFVAESETLVNELEKASLELVENFLDDRRAAKH